MYVVVHGGSLLTHQRGLKHSTSRGSVSSVSLYQGPPNDSPPPTLLHLHMSRTAVEFIGSHKYLNNALGGVVVVTRALERTQPVAHQCLLCKRQHL